MRNADNKIVLIPNGVRMSIPPYQLSQIEEDEITIQLKDYTPTIC